MTRIAVNKCYGGFSISAEALVELVKMKSDVIESMSLKDYTGDQSTMDEYKAHHTYASFKKIGGFEAEEYGVLHKDNMVYFLKDKHDNETRTHKDLIYVIEKMGEKSWGRCSQLDIVEIPDNVNWEIDEYDGMESVDEVHRSW